MDAVCFCYGVIGEAARHIPDDVVGAYPDLPWAEMRAMRNVVVHKYFGVTPETLWETAPAKPAMTGLNPILLNDLILDVSSKTCGMVRLGSMGEFRLVGSMGGSA